MMANLFSVFDPAGVSLFSSLWVSLASTTLVLGQGTHLLLSGVSAIVCYVVRILKDNFDSLLTPGSDSMVSPTLISCFTVILWANLTGLTPYTLTTSAFITVGFTMSMGLWLGPVIFSLWSSPSHWLAHLVPLGTPPALMPLMVLIESISLLIRPLTLAVRLMANMLAGHLILSLAGAALTLSLAGSVVLAAQSALVILELAVALLQAFVFTTLLTLYSKEKSD